MPNAELQHSMPPPYQAIAQGVQQDIADEADRPESPDRVSANQLMEATSSTSVAYHQHGSGAPLHNQDDWSPPEYENLDCLDSIAKKVWNFPWGLHQDRLTRYTVMIQIYFFAKWQHAKHVEGTVATEQFDAFVRHIRGACKIESEHDQIYKARDNELEATFQNRKLETLDPRFSKLGAQMNDAWETMPDLEKWRMVRDWQGIELDP